MTMKPSQILKLDRKYVFRKSFTPFIIDRAKDSTIIDAYGKKYIDLFGGLYGTISVGWQRPEVIKAMKMQMSKVNFAPEKVPSEVCSTLAERLVKLTKNRFQKCLRATSGTEAVELAIKAARSYSNKKRILSAINAYHGQAYAGLSLEGTNTDLRRTYGPLLPKVDFIPFPYLYRKMRKDTARQTSALRYLTRG